MGLKKVGFYFSFFGSFVTTFLVLTSTATCGCLNDFFFKELSSTDEITESLKWQIVRSLAAKIALFLFSLASCVMGCRILLKKSSPATEQDPEIIALLNRIISNTIQQSIIFLALYSYFLFDKSGDRFTVDELLVFASWFLLSRLAFAIGYFLGNYIKIPVLRAFGFNLNMATVLILIQLNFFNCGLLSKFFFHK